SAPTRRVMPFRASDTLRGPRLAMRSARAPRIAQLSSALAGPALDQFIVLDGFALGLLVFELRLRATLADPLLGVLLLVQARTATAIDLGLLVGGLHARHDLVHLAGEPVHGLLRREGAGVHVADVLPPELGELRIVGDVDPGRRPVDPVGRTIELHQAA